MNKFLYMPVVLGLVLGCAGYAAGNGDNENQQDPRPLLRQQIDSMKNQMQELDDQLKEIGRQHPELNADIQNLKDSKRNIVDWRHVEIRDLQRRIQNGEDVGQQYEGYLEAIRKAEADINPVMERLQAQGLGEVINIVDEYAKLTVDKFDASASLIEEERARR